MAEIYPIVPELRRTGAAHRVPCVRRRARTIRTALAALALCACTTSPEAPTSADSASVSEVLDGDTLLIRLGGRHEQVRLIGIDTPEVAHPTRPVECFGAEATTRIAELLPPGTRVRLVLDVESRDRFDRLLAYVYRAEDDLFVNLVMAEEGFAAPLAIAPNMAHSEPIAAAARRARAGGLGLWGACGGPDVPVEPEPR